MKNLPRAIFCLLFLCVLTSSNYKDLQACVEPPPPEFPPGVDVEQDMNNSRIFKVTLLDQYSSFGAPAGEHFCVCGLGVYQSQWNVAVLAARLVYRGTDDVFEEFNFSENFDTTTSLNIAIPVVDIEWIGLFAEINAAVPSGVALDLQFILFIDLPPAGPNLLQHTAANPTVADVFALLGFVATDEGNAAGELTNGHLGVFDISSQLPVELTSFIARVNLDVVNLYWSTSSESNNAGFEVQYDRGSGFEVHGFVDGQGDSIEHVDYTYQIEGLTPGKYLFRLKQIDYDGKEEYSDVIEAAYEIPSLVEVYPPFPNPFTDQTKIQFAVRESQDVEVVMVDALGKIVEKHRVYAQAGNTESIQFDSANLSSGLYLVKVTGESFLKSFPVNLNK